MNIAIFSRVLFLSGVSTHIIDLSQELIKKGNKVFIFTSGPEYPNNKANVQLMDRLLEIGATIVKIPFPTDSRNKIKYGIGLFSSLPEVKKQLRVNAVDIIHIHTPALSLLPILLRRKFVKTVHNSDLSSLGVLNRKATHEVAISRETYEKSKNLFGYKDDELTLIFNGVDDRFSILADDRKKKEIKESKQIPLNKVVIGVVGNIQFIKGHDILLNAISILPSSIKEKIHLIVLGNGEKNEIEWLQKSIDSNDLQNVITRLPFQDPKPIYDVIDIFVSPSRMEGFSLVAVEALLSGCCVIRSEVGGAHEQIENNINGFLFENENTGELTSILIRLIEDEDLRKQVAVAGRENALKKFTSDIMAEKTLEVYQKVIELK